MAGEAQTVHRKVSIEHVPTKKKALGKIKGLTDDQIVAKFVMRADDTEPSNEELACFTEASWDPQRREAVMHKIWGRLRWTGKAVKGHDWKKVWRALRVLRHLCLHGSGTVVEEAHAKRDLLKIMSDEFQGADPQGSRQVREQAGVIYALVTSSGSVRERARDEAAKRPLSGRAATESQPLSDEDSAFVQRQMARFRREEAAETKHLSVCKENDGTVGCTLGRCIVLRVDRDSPAQRAGLGRGMLITQVHDTPVSTYEGVKFGLSQAPREFRLIVRQLSDSSDPGPPQPPSEDGAVSGAAAALDSAGTPPPPQRDWLSELLGVTTSSPPPAPLQTGAAPTSGLDLDSLFSGASPVSPTPQEQQPGGVQCSTAGRRSAPRRPPPGLPPAQQPGGCAGVPQSQQHRDPGQADSPDLTGDLELHCHVAPSLLGSAHGGLMHFMMVGGKEYVGQVVGFDVDEDPVVKVPGKDPMAVPRNLVERCPTPMPPPPSQEGQEEAADQLPPEALLAVRGAHGSCGAHAAPASHHPAPAPASVAADSTREVASFLGRLGLSKYTSVFHKEEWTAQALAHITEEDLDVMGIRSVGPRRMILKGAEQLKEASIRQSARGPEEVSMMSQRLTVRFGRFDLDWGDGTMTRGLERDQLRPLPTGTPPLG
eukprot:TRINITY_DN6706_c0_g1_i5.p1 TRINITY_DN6706_c0_g1~~TRINITY_DN6706_c0_g1_i5.p1  ORF type:complete len:654 (+),score=126.88 TRINITY_DN6706_c0_g1_i5:76-2037(+)